MSRRQWRPRQRPLIRTLADAVVFAALFAMVMLGLRLSGWQARPARGSFIAVDGDSLRKGEEDFRLAAIDAPELHQTCEDGDGRDYSCGRDAQRALSALVGGGPLDCLVRDVDRYRRSVAVCSKGTLDINAEMVRRGWAIAYRRHGTDYVDEEDEARRARRGIWQGRFEEPERWRARHRNELMRGGMSIDDALQD